MSNYPQSWQNDHRPPLPTPSSYSTPSFATAGWALGLAIAGCCFIGNIASTFMAFSVLRRSKETRENHGKGLAVAALAINALTAGSIVVVLYFGLVLGMFSVETPSVVKPPTNADPRVVDDVGTLQPGDCIQVPSMRGKEGYDRVVDCAGRHDAEVTHRIALSDDRYPGGKKLDRRAEACTGASFKRYVGAAYEDTLLDVRYFYPTKETWLAGDRTIVCMVASLDGQMKGSLKGSHKGNRKGSEGSGDTA